MAALADFRIEYPNFASIDDSVVTYYLNKVLCMFDEGRWGCHFDAGHLALTAHEIYLYNRRSSGDASTNNPSQVLASKSIGDVSVSFANPAINDIDDAYYMSTEYGQTYVTLRNLVGIGATTAGNVCLV